MTSYVRPAVMQVKSNSTRCHWSVVAAQTNKALRARVTSVAGTPAQDQVLEVRLPLMFHFRGWWR